MSQQRKTTTDKREAWFSSAVFLCLAGALAAALLVALPLLVGPGLLNTRGGGDSPFLLQRLHQLETALRDGHFPVRWMPDANYGYGYPFYNFYAPLSIYITAVFRLFGFSFVRAIQLAQLAGFLAAAGGMFALARRWFGNPWAGLLASVAYTTAPFHMVNIYVRGDSLAEFWAMAFYPLVLLTADGVLAAAAHSPFSTKQVGRPVALFALAYAALVLSHNISALIFSPFLLLYLLLRCWFGRREAATTRQGVARAAALPVAGLFLALALAAWFFVPALAEQSLAQLGPVTEGYFHFGNHFRGTDLVQRSWLFDYEVDRGNAFKMGLAQGITAVSGLLLLLFWRKNRPASPVVAWFVGLSMLVATVMITPLSRWLWETLPLLSFTQFPWRFLSVQAFAGALAAGALALLPGRKWLVPALSALLLLSALADLHPDYMPLSDADVTARKLAEYEWYSGNIGSTVSAEYLPPAVQPRPYTSPWLNEGDRDRVAVLAGMADVALIERRTARQLWSVAAQTETTLVLPTLAWPGWIAELDGQRLTSQPAPGSGLMMVTLPPGDHQLALRLSHTPVRLGAEMASVTAVFILLFLLWPPRWRWPGRQWIVAVVGLLLIFIAVTIWRQKPLPATNLNWDFAQMAYLHHADESIAFSEGLALTAYQYSADSLQAGQTLVIEMQWAGEAVAASPQVTVALYSPAITRPGLVDIVEPPAFAVAAAPLTAQQTFSLTLPSNMPPGLYAPRLLVAGHQPLTNSGLVRGDLFLRPTSVSAAAGAELAARGDLDVALETAVLRPDEPVLDLHLAWFTARPLTQNYNVSLRLTDAQGQWLRQMDVQPGFGFLPSSGWQPGEWTPDWLALSLPTLSPTAGPYPLMVQLYEVAAPETAVLTRRLGVLRPEDGTWQFQPHTPHFDAPEKMTPVTAVFGDAIRLLGYDLAQTEREAKLTLYWQALAEGQVDYTRFVHLADSEPGQPPLRQQDSYPVFNSYPTGQWTAGEIVPEVVRLDLTGLPPGQYSLLTGFYQRLADGVLARVTAVAPDGAPLPDDRVFLTTLVIEE